MKVLIEEKNIKRVISDFDTIEEAIKQSGIEVPEGTDTSEYADKISEIAEKAYAKGAEEMGKTKADIDLKNVSNEDFKAKAQEAGIGVDDEAGFPDDPKCIMEFMGVVSELPSDAEEGQVYAVSKTAVTKGEQLSSGDAAMQLSMSSSEMYGTYPGWGIMSECFSYINQNPNCVLIVVDEETGKEYWIRVDSIRNDEDNAEAIFYGTTSVADGENVFFNSNATIYVGNGEIISKTCVRFNGEWVEL